MATIDTLKQIGQIGIMIICVAVVIAIGLSVWSQSLESWYEDCDTKYGGGNWSVKEEVCGMDICYKCQYNASLQLSLNVSKTV